MHYTPKDHFPFEILHAKLKHRHFVVLTVDITVETSEPDMFKEIKRGIYSFSSQKKQIAFTSGCNCDTTEDVAYRFTLKQN